MTKGRLSVSVEADLIQAGRAAVDAGQADSVSAWVAEALRLKVDHDRRMRALDAFVAAYEAEHGVIGDDEIAGAVRRARARATVVRSQPGDAVGMP
ncbi:MAG TPA: hypothetical protein VFW71_11510 [Actinomycetota bacterium]|nr:hypothetical protein [Actinomycetota bacterium]